MTPVPSAAGPADTALASRKRSRPPKIDIDARIASYVTERKQAERVLAAASAKAKAEKRKKRRLVKKASMMTADDLERIAVLKRCGLWDPVNGVTLQFGEKPKEGEKPAEEPPSASPAAASSGSTTPSALATPVPSQSSEADPEE